MYKSDHTVIELVLCHAEFDVFWIFKGSFYLSLTEGVELTEVNTCKNFLCPLLFCENLFSLDLMTLTVKCFLIALPAIFSIIILVISVSP